MLTAAKSHKSVLSICWLGLVQFRTSPLELKSNVISVGAFAVGFPPGVTYIETFSLLSSELISVSNS